MTEKERVSGLVISGAQEHVEKEVEQAALTREFLDMQAKANFRKQAFITICGVSLLIIAVLLAFEFKESSDERSANAKVLAANQEGTKEAVEELRTLVLGFENITSESATASSQAQLATTLRIVLQNSACDNNEATQKLADALVSAGLLRPGDVNVRCLEPPPTIPGETTTTVPGG